VTHWGEKPLYFEYSSKNQAMTWEPADTSGPGMSLKGPTISFRFCTRRSLLCQSDMLHFIVTLQQVSFATDTQFPTCHIPLIPRSRSHLLQTHRVQEFQKYVHEMFRV
jgi:hypothetical protein